MTYIIHLDYCYEAIILLYCTQLPVGLEDRVIWTTQKDHDELSFHVPVREAAVGMFIGTGSCTWTETNG